MKLRKASLFCALFAAVCLPAIAQTGMRVNIPFGFTVAGKSLPAGHYTVMSDFTTGHTEWRIYNGHDGVITHTRLVQSPQTEHRLSLVFLQTNEGYSLVQIWPSEHSGRDLPRPNTKQTLVATGGKYVEIGAE
jgi:hypothetical protein